MTVLEITLAVILTLLGLAILAILLTRWARRKQSEMYISRYSSEQSARLLDYEDGRDFSSQRSKRGRGSRHAYSTQSDTSYDNRERSKRDYTPSTNSLVSMASKFSLGQTELILLLMCFILALSRSSIGSIKCLQTTEEPPSRTAGAMMQFTAPIPGATGPFKLSQKTIVQTLGPIVQYPGSNAGPPSAPRGPPMAPIIISQRTASQLAAPIIISQRTARQRHWYLSEEKWNCQQRIIRIPQVHTMDSSGKITLTPVVILTGYMDEELAKKSCSKIQILKCGGTARSQNSREENKEALKNDIIFTNSVESLKSAHIKEPEREGKGTDLEKDKIGMEVKVDSDAGIPKRQETQLKISEMSVPQGQGAQIKKSVSDVPRGQESQVKKSESGVPKGQEAQVTKSGLVVLKGQEAQVEKSEMGVPRRQESQVKKSQSGVSKGQEAQVKQRESVVLKGQEAQVEKSELKVPKGQEGQVEKTEADVPKEQEVQEKKSEAGVLKGPESQVKNTEVSVPETLESQVKKSESGVLKGQEAQEKKESFEDKGNNDKEKERDAEKDPNKKEKGDKNTKGDKGKDKVKGKRESEINGEKSKGSKRAKANTGRKYNKKVEE
ncbi:testis-expressed basic protein 1 isoform X2 [Homo sapiens]|uniref:testis-expressed basic protein 1 isoform X2 n=1 Tax=Homo sapiens TaxID=9606 RepID=UPI0023DEE539|nr:testis-expressed basic protein 1 isoform X2 [Homo sapiens]